MVLIERQAKPSKNSTLYRLPADCFVQFQRQIPCPDP